MATDARGHTVPTGNDFAQRSSLTDLSLSIGDIKTCSSASAANLHLAALADAGVTPSAASPIWVYRSDLKELHAYASSTPTVVAQSPVQQLSGDIPFAAIANGSGSTYGVTFAQPFASAPAVMVSTTQGRWTPYRTNITATGVTIGVNNWSGATGAAGTVSWLAIGTPA